MKKFAAPSKKKFAQKITKSNHQNLSGTFLIIKDLQNTDFMYVIEINWVKFTFSWKNEPKKFSDRNIFFTLNKF